VIKYGDLQFIEMKDDYILIACDSSGSIGNKKHDSVQIEPEIAGYYGAFVPLVEVLAVKGKILSLVDTLSVEMEPTGKRIINGIQQALKELNIDDHLLTGSTEDNIPTTSTGIGVTVIGQIAKQAIESKQVNNTHSLILMGLPKVGEEFVNEELIEQQGETLTLDLMKHLTTLTLIDDMIPVGSKGIAYEANVLSKRNNLLVSLYSIKHKDKRIDYNKSAGPSTCLLACIDKNRVSEFIRIVKTINTTIPINEIGKFEDYRDID